MLQQRGAQQVLRRVQGQGVAQLGAADDAGLFANQVARIGAGPVAVSVLAGGVKFVRCRKVVRVLVAHEVQRHLRGSVRLKCPKRGNSHCAANVGIVPTCLVEDELQAGTLVEPLKDRFDSPLGYYLCTPTARTNLSVYRLVAGWLEHCCNHAEGAAAAVEAGAGCIFCALQQGANGANAVTTAAAMAG